MNKFSNNSLKPFDLHRHLINQYLLTRKKSPIIDGSKPKRDIDIIKENHKFLWDDDDQLNTWEKKLAKKYYDKLYKEYCICDLSRFKENKIAMRWQIELELISGKGQFICGEKHCSESESLRTWEVNFAYLEDGVNKNTLVKLRLCHKCSLKLNYKKKRKEVTKVHKKRECSPVESTEKRLKKMKTKTDVEENNDVGNEVSEEGHEIWKEVIPSDEQSRDEDFENYLEMLLL